MLRSQKKHPKNGAEELIINHKQLTTRQPFPQTTKGLSQSLKWHLNSNVSKFRKPTPAVRNQRAISLAHTVQ
jgi:hypothetical protein